MKANRYLIIIIIRVILITLTSLAFVWFLTETSRPATTLFFLILIIIQTVSLILFLNHVNRDLANFLIYLQENDTSLIYSRNRVEKNFKNVMTSLNEINRKIQDARVSREEKHQYLKAVIEHMDIGVITFDSKANVELVNQTALEMFGVSSLTKTDDLFNSFPDMEEVITNASTGKTSMVKINVDGKSRHLAVKSKSIRIGNEQINIVSFQNIKNELEANELESWKKLIRILRHEIMNSITPITTLTTAIRRSFSRNSEPKPLKELDASNIEVALTSAEVIEERSKGLISFVEKFRSITDLPKPVFKEFSVQGLFEKTRVLFQDVLTEKGINISVQLSQPDLTLNADEHLLEQVIINMVKNSIEAMDRGGEIILKAFNRDSETITLQVIDNGMGIPPENLESVFVPSFTTKEHGLGVGLSISRQIVRLHNGNITVNSKPGETVFEIVLSK